VARESMKHVPTGTVQEHGKGNTNALAK
jgi:hypothetical protein